MLCHIFQFHLSIPESSIPLNSSQGTTTIGHSRETTSQSGSLGSVGDCPMYGFNPQVPYGPYSPVTTPLPSVGVDTQLYSPQQFPYTGPPYYHQVVPPSLPYLNSPYYHQVVPPSLPYLNSPYYHQVVPPSLPYLNQDLVESGQTAQNH
ncbi:hypothetical protein JHK87_027905 [Glycine soja]|nr:hypothetical protein JHK87_027905 [Glycine soja]